MADKIPDWAKEPIDLTNVPLNSPLFDNINPNGVEQVDDTLEDTPVASATEAIPDWALTPTAETTEAIPDWAQTAAPETKTPYKPSSFARRAIADTGIGLAQGVVGLGEGLVGIADIPTLGYAGKGIEAAEKAIFGGTSKDLQQNLQELKTPELREQEKAVQEAKGVKNTALALAKNPLAFLGLIEQSLPSMYGGVGIARKVLQKTPKLGTATAVGIGEGAITGGSIAEDARQQSEDGLITPKQAVIATGSGILTGGLGAMGSKIATKIGLDDFETLLTKSASPTIRTTATQNLTKAIKSGLAESTLEELPQSIQEQIAQNLANDRPWDEGVAEAATQGALVGFAVAGGYSGINSTIQNSRIDKEVEKQDAEEGEKKELSREKLIDQYFQDLVTRSEQIKTKTTPEPEVTEEPTTILNKTTLTSWGLNPRSNAFKALEGVDASTNEGLDLVQKTLEANKGKINETAVDDYLKGVESGRPISGTTRISDAVSGGSKYGTPGGIEGRFGPTVNISGGPIGVIETGEETSNAPLETVTEDVYNQPQGRERVLTLQQLLNDPDPMLRREARRKFVRQFKEQHNVELAKIAAQLDELAPKQDPVERRADNMARYLENIPNPPSYLIEDLRNPEMIQEEKEDLIKTAKNYALSEQVSELDDIMKGEKKYVQKMTVEEQKALAKEAREATEAEATFKTMADEDVAAMQEEYMAQQKPEDLFQKLTPIESTEWFKDAKLVDESGAPLRLYHGTTKDISTLRSSKDGSLGAGIYLTPDAEFAGRYAEQEGGNILPVYTNIKNPLVIKSEMGKGDPMVQALIQLGVAEDKAADIVEKAYEEKGYISKEVQSRAQKQGYDGIVQYKDGKLSEIVAFNAAQVKSALGDLQSKLEGTPEGKAVVNSTKPAKTLGQALTIIKNQHFDKLNPAQKIMHNVVTGLGNVVKGTYKVMGLEKGEFGKYSPTMNKTTISPDAGIETIYHEASHSATTWEIKKHVTMKNGRPVARTKIGEDLVAIFDAAEARAMQEERDFGEAFKNMDEFVANAFNNEDFERFLADTPSVVESPAPLTSLWTDWLNALVDMFKIPNMDKSLLSDLVSVAPDLFVGTRPENLKNFPAVEPLYQKNANKTADQLQEETGINKLNTGSSKSIFKTIADLDIKHAIRNFTSAVFSSDSALNAAMREAMDKAGLPFSKIKEVVQSMMTSQALHAENIASYFLELGGIRYNNDSFTFEVIPSESGASWGNMMKRIGEIGKQYGKSFEKMELHAHTYFVARRANELIKSNTALKQRVLKLLVNDDKKGAKKLWEKQYKLVHLNKKQIEAGLALRDKFPELDGIVDQWNEVRTNVIQFLVDTGYYNQEDATDLVEAMEYVPFYRVAQLEAGEGPRERTRGLLDRTRDKRFKGSYDAVNNVFDNMERWITYSIRKGIGNKTAQNAVKAMQELMPDDISGPLPQGANVNPGNKIEVWQNGTPRIYKLEDPLFVHYFTGAQAAFGPLVDFFTPTNRFFRASVIYDPIFSVKQVIMDAQSAMTTSGVKYPFKIPLLAVKEFFLTLGDWSNAHKELRAVGAVGERSYSEVTSRIDVETRAGLRRPNLAERIVSGALKPFKWFAMVSDNAVRQAVYEQTLKETGDKGAAIARAFEIINFKRSGYSSTANTARQVIPFFGAYLQALNVIGKTITGRGISPTTRKAAYTRLASTMTQVAMFSFLYAMLMSDDDDYKDTDTTTRDLRYFIPGLTDYGVWLPVRADPFTLFNKMFVEHYVNLTKTEQTEDWTKFKKAFKDFATSAFLGPTPMPQLAKTVLEANMNYSLNTDRAIVGQGLAGRATERQFTATTSLLARDMSKATGDTVSPITIDYYMRQLAGSLSGVSIFLYDKLYRDANAPEKSTRDTIAQFAPGFVKKEFGTKAKNDLYELRDIIDEAYQTFNDMSKFATPEEFYKSEQYNKAGEKLAVKPAIEVLIKQLARNRVAERQIRERPPKDMTKEQKEAILKSMKEGERQLLKDIQIFRIKAGLDEDNPFREKPDWAQE